MLTWPNRHTGYCFIYNFADIHSNQSSVDHWKLIDEIDTVMPFTRLKKIKKFCNKRYACIHAISANETVDLFNE